MNLIAKDIMTKEVITIKEDCSVYEAIEILLMNRINCLPVVTAEGILVGMVTETDLIYVDRKLNPSFHYAYSDLNVQVNKRILERDIKNMKEIKVKDIMSKKLETVNEEASLEKVIDIIINKKIKTIPVIKDSKVSGIVTRRDILKYYVNLEHEKASC